MQVVEKYMSDDGKLHNDPVDALVADLVNLRYGLSSWVITRAPSILHSCPCEVNQSVLLSDFKEYERGILARLTDMRTTVETLYKYLQGSERKE